MQLTLLQCATSCIPAGVSQRRTENENDGITTGLI